MAASCQIISFPHYPPSISGIHYDLSVPAIFLFLDLSVDLAAVFHTLATIKIYRLIDWSTGYDQKLIASIQQLPSVSATNKANKLYQQFTKKDQPSCAAVNRFAVWTRSWSWDESDASPDRLTRLLVSDSASQFDPGRWQITPEHLSMQKHWN